MSHSKQLIDKINRQLVCSQLIVSVVPYKNIRLFHENREALLAAKEFINHFDKSKGKKAKEISRLLQISIDEAKQMGILKKPEDEIAEKFENYCSTHSECYRFGIEFGWLEELVDCKKLGFPKDLPYQTRIGIGNHAGTLNVEEKFLLQDSFFLLLKTKEAYNELVEYNKKWDNREKHVRIDDVLYHLSYANQTVAIYSRLTILSFFAFFEAFVNSVGYDFSQRNKSSISSHDDEILKGTKKGHFLSLENKIEKFPTIIRVDKKPVIITSDTKQIKEPFIRLLGRIKDIRNSSVHYSPLKENNWKPPTEWHNETEKTAKDCVNAALIFWKACYPESPDGPKYLHDLNFDKNIALARNAMTWKKELDIIENT